MPDPGPDPDADRLRQAEGLLRAGRRPEAEQALRELAAAEPGCSPALHLLGRLAYGDGRFADAAALFARAAAAAPGDALPLSCAGAAWQAAGRPRDAEPWHRKALSLAPDDPLVLNNLAITLVSLGRPADAAAVFRRLADADPKDAAAWCNLAGVLRTQGKRDEAESAARRALEVEPELAEAHANLGAALADAGRYDEAEAACRRALSRRPSLAAAWGGLGEALLRRGRPAEAAPAFDRAARLAPADPSPPVRLAEALLALHRAAEAVECCRRALTLRPDDPDAWNTLGNARAAGGELDEAGSCYREAARLRADWSAPRYNLGVALLGQGRLAEARSCFDEALRLNPGDAVAHSTSVGALFFDPEIGDDALLAEHRRWAERHAPAAAGPAHANVPDPERRLRVGYVSPDFRSHAVAFFLEPVLAQHDPGRVEVFCYADVAAPDETTARLRGLAHQWRPTQGLTDEELAAQVCRDGIDLLVDLCGHLAGHRLRAFARRPAPVQVSWLGYPGTTGLAAMDYRLTDAVCDPEGGETPYTEKLVRLPGVFCCYAPPLQVPQETALPSEKEGVVTFGSLHKLEKLNDRVVELWTKLLLEVPGSRLLLCRNTLRGATADHWRGRFARAGLPAERLEVRCVEPVGLQHLRVYDGIDVALDAFPWSGHTTACEALWMGVPTVTLRGNRCAGRMVASVLAAAGLGDLIAGTPDDYRRIAAGLAADAARRKELRENLRGRLLRSPLCDKAGFTRGLEDAYRTLWRAWCGGRRGGAAGCNDEGERS